MHERYVGRVYDFVYRTVRVRVESSDLTRAALVDGLTDLLVHPVVREGEPAGGDPGADVRASIFGAARGRVAERLSAAGRLNDPRPIDEAESRAAGFDVAGNLEPRSEVGGPPEDEIAKRIVGQLQAAQPHPDPAARGESARLVWRAAASLGPRQYMALDLHRRQGLADEPLARALGLPRAASEALLGEAEGALRGLVWTSALVPSSGEDASPSCPQMAALSRRLDGESTSLEDWLTIERHASVCSVCTAQRDRLGVPGEVFANLAPAPMPVELKNSVWRELAARWPDDEHGPPLPARRSFHLPGAGGAALFGRLGGGHPPTRPGAAGPPGSVPPQDFGPVGPPGSPPPGLAARVGAFGGPARPDADASSAREVTGPDAAAVPDSGAPAASASTAPDNAPDAVDGSATRPSTHTDAPRRDDVQLDSPYVRSRAASELLARTRQARIPGASESGTGGQAPWLVDDSALAPARTVRLRTQPGFALGRWLAVALLLFMVGAAIGIATNRSLLLATLPRISLPDMPFTAAASTVTPTADASPSGPAADAPAPGAAAGSGAAATPAASPSEAAAPTVAPPEATATALLPTVAPTATPAPTDTPVPASPTPAPTNTPEPPTATPAPPTPTAAPPTATPVPPTATRVPPTATRVPPTATRPPPTEAPTEVPTPAPTQAPSRSLLVPVTPARR